MTDAQTSWAGCQQYRTKLEGVAKCHAEQRLAIHQTQRMINASSAVQASQAQDCTWYWLYVRSNGAASLYSSTEGRHLGRGAQVYCCDEGVGDGKALHGGAGVACLAHHLRYQAPALQSFSHHLRSQKQTCA